jgi:hypothetical protein
VCGFFGTVDLRVDGILVLLAWSRKKDQDLSLSLALNNYLRTDADKGNPTV